MPVDLGPSPPRSDFRPVNRQTVPVQPPAAASPVAWLANQPYLLLGLAMLFWAGNIVLGRYVAAHVPPVAMSCIRWIGACLMILPWAWPHLRRDWPALRAHLPLMVVLSATGFAINTTLSYWALQYTEALNAPLIQSAGPLFVALWSLILFGVRLTFAQLTGIAISLVGVLTIILRGDFAALAGVQFNKGDVMLALALLAFGLYSALMPRRPLISPFSLIVFTTGCGALCLVPLLVWELFARPVMQIDVANLLSLAYVAVFPSTLAYLCYNRGGN